MKQIVMNEHGNFLIAMRADEVAERTADRLRAATPQLPAWIDEHTLPDFVEVGTESDIGVHYFRKLYYNLIRHEFPGARFFVVFLDRYPDNRDVDGGKIAVLVAVNENGELLGALTETLRR